MSSNFDVREHRIPATHIREYPRATADGDADVLHLAVKQYTPTKTYKARKEITIIGAHANGFPKELYEPLWDELYERLKANEVSISSIWIADVAHQGLSSVINEDLLGNDPSWADHPRDLLHMVNHFRQHMKPPLIGIGHSMGGNNLVNLALLHPRLLTSLVLIDPVIQRNPSVEGNYSPVRASINRREIWPSRKEAAKKLKASKFYHAWDPRVLDRWIQYGLRELPTRIHPEVPTSSTPPALSADPSSGLTQPSRDDVPVTLTTTKHQEVLTFVRANLPTAEYPDPGKHPNPITNPDVDTDSLPAAPFYSPVPIATFHRLPYLRPSVFYIFGSESVLSHPLLKADKLAHTGTCVGGSGGGKAKRVAGVTFQGVGHLIPMEVVDKTADAAVGWLVPELARWREVHDAERKEWEQVPVREKAKIPRDYEQMMQKDWVKEAVSTKKAAKL